jgi:hypothetical protein
MSYRAEVAKIVYMLAQVLRDEATEAMIDGWVAVLQDEKISIEDAQKAAVIVMKSRQYNKLPSPAVFLEILKPQENTEMIAGEQADLVLEKLRSMGPCRAPEFEDQTTAYLMERRWPWRSFCENLLTEEVKWWRKEFVAEYAARRNEAERLKLTTPSRPELTDGQD